MDETLARPVSVLTFAQGFPRVTQVVTAARAASRLTDPRMAQVFDVEDGGGQAYIVLEWVGGETLTELLTDGPLDPGRACSLITDATRALAGAHALGQAHLRLTPDSLCWTRSSGIKITGLGIDAALAGDGLTGTAAQDPAVADTIALAGLLYAAVTGYWPGEEPARLPAAPVSEGGLVCTPRQVSADVSSAIDSVVTRALLQRPTRQGQAISTPAAFAEALAGVAPPVPLPEPAPQPQAGYANRGGYRGYSNDPNNPDTWAVSEQGPGGTSPYPQRKPPPAQFASNGYGGSQYTPASYQGTERGGTSRVMIVVVAVLVLAVIGATVWAVGLRKSNNSSAGGSGTGGGHPTTSQSATPTGTTLTPVGDSTFNILGTDSEDANQAPNAIDGSTSTYWATDYYFQPNFGGKLGTGLIIDMGKSVRLSQVQVAVGTIGTTTAEIYLGNNNAKSKTALQNFTKVGKSTGGTGTLTYSISSQATGRYVLVWLTGDLPVNPDQQGTYQGRIYNVVVRGTTVSAAG
jgi:hypothetical protein